MPPGGPPPRPGPRPPGRERGGDGPARRARCLGVAGRSRPGRPNSPTCGSPLGAGRASGRAAEGEPPPPPRAPGGAGGRRDPRATCANPRLPPRADAFVSPGPGERNHFGFAFPIAFPLQFRPHARLSAGQTPWESGEKPSSFKNKRVPSWAAGPSPLRAASRNGAGVPTPRVTHRRQVGPWGPDCKERGQKGGVCRWPGSPRPLRTFQSWALAAAWKAGDSGRGWGCQGGHCKGTPQSRRPAAGDLGWKVESFIPSNHRTDAPPPPHYSGNGAEGTGTEWAGFCLRGRRRLHRICVTSASRRTEP